METIVKIVETANPGEGVRLHLLPLTNNQNRREEKWK